MPCCRCTARRFTRRWRASHCVPSTRPAARSPISCAARYARSSSAASAMHDAHHVKMIFIDFFFFLIVYYFAFFFS